MQPTEEELIKDGDPTERAGLYEGDIDMAYHEVCEETPMHKDDMNSSGNTLDPGHQHDQRKAAETKERHQATGIKSIKDTLRTPISRWAKSALEVW